MKKYTLLFGVLFICWASFSQKNTTEQNNTGLVITCSDFHVTKPLSEFSIPAKENPKKDVWEKMKESKDRENRDPQKFVHTVDENPTLYGNDPSSIQTEMGENNANTKAPIKNWPGQVASGFRPMDPSGAAGPNHYIQAINGTPFRVFDKNTGANLLTANIGTLWSPATPDNGDPIVLYDKYVDRWVITQFGSETDKKIYIAVSKTADPLGQYYTYTFTSPLFPDYLKFGIWENGYYMTSNNTSRVFCFERAQMIVGNASARAVSQTFTPGSTTGFFCPLPADADGGLPVAGTPCPFFCYTDNAWGGGAVDGVKIWDMTVTWGATPVATIVLKATLPTAAFDASYDSGWDDISQPGTTQKLDGIGGVPTFRAQWRKWTGYNTIVLNWGVKISATQRSIKWVELRQNQTTGVWTLFQEGTYTPDAHSRWLGSISMDKNGSIALCYAKSSTSVYPSLCYTGRLSTDPLGTMSFAETVAAAGTTSETSGNRFGDYSHTSMDPDDETFWHTGEYCPAGGTSTRVYSFKIPAPIVGQTASVTITSSDSDNSICAGASVTFTAVAVNGGAAPTYQWKLNGTNIAGATSATYTTNALTTGQSITCQMTSNLVGVIGSPATSNAIVTTVNATPATPVITTNSPVCLGSAINLTTPAVATATYAWTGVNSFTNTTQNPTIAVSTAPMAGAYNLIITVNGCPSLAGTSSVVITPTVVPSVVIAITAGSNPTCSTQSVTFTATPTNGGTPSYQWKVNGVNAGTNSAIFTPATIANGAIITCVMTSTATCTTTATATSNAITMIVNAVPATPVVTTNSPVCLGSAINLTTPTVASATYAWTGVNSYTNATQNPTIAVSTAPMAGAYSLIITVNGCPSLAGTSSVVVTPTVVPSVVIAITAGSNPTCSTQSVTFTATPTNGGTPSYQWKVNGVNTGTNSATFTPATIANGAIITCVMTSTATCPSTTTATSNAITMTVTTTLVPSVTIVSNNNPFCLGTSVTFTPTPVNGGTAPTYQWVVNGVNSLTGATFTSTTIANNDIVTCVMTSNSACASPLTATSNALTMIVSGSVVPAVAITASATTICTGASTVFTAVPTNGGTTPSYQWKVNGVNVGSNLITYTSTTLANNDIVTCEMTSNSSCASPLIGTSNAITMIVSGSVVPSVTISITAGTNPTCTGSSVTFTAAPTNGGTTPSYQWKVNGGNVGTNNVAFTSTTLANNDIVTCVMTSSSSCASPLTGTSNTITMTFTASLTPTVAISITTGSNPACPGTTETFTASSTNGGTPVYQWKVNGVNTVTGTTFTTSTLANNDIVTCVLTSNAACISTTTATSNAITMNMVGSLIPTISITSSSPSNCIGSLVTFTSVISNGGASPSYVWNINGAPVANGATYLSSSITAIDVVTCILTSNATCLSTPTATSNPLTVNLTATVNPAVSVAITFGANPACQGANLSFTASTSNGGSNPGYVWKINGIAVSGANSSIFSTSTLSNNDIVTCVLTSNAPCVSSTTVTSTGTPITIYPIPATPTITHVGTVLTSSAATGNQWYLNGVIIIGATSQSYTSTVNGIYTVIVDNNNGCPSNVSANYLENSVGLYDVANEGTHFVIFPNPSNGFFTVVFTSSEIMKYKIELINELGQIVFLEEIKDFNGTYTKDFDVTQKGRGEYFLRITDSKKNQMEKVIVY